MVRFKVRYLLAQIVWDDGKVDQALSAAALQKLVKNEVRDKFGDYGSATCTHNIHGLNSLFSLSFSFESSISTLCYFPLKFRFPSCDII
ncbi:hypothetical protein BVRB_042340 [Beta vulgaris subsp. vulgaris]|uniref:Uncharacterized protein n=1 Tax=Beta vulgaris subsp. vulgaris TaxID=3555 RepID=A0A0J7YMJ1_BETVV|nr:hypothetical protein BVRB_042340 [Beta vulgaris subsp. vulgaris]